MEKELIILNKRKSNNVSRWTIDMGCDVWYSTFGYPAKKGFVSELINIWKDAELFRTMDAYDGVPNMHKRILWLKLKGYSIFVSSYNKDNCNYVCFIEPGRSPVQTWNGMKKKMNVYINEDASEIKKELNNNRIDAFMDGIFVCWCENEECIACNHIIPFRTKIAWEIKCEEANKPLH